MIVVVFNSVMRHRNVVCGYSHNGCSSGPHFSTTKIIISVHSFLILRTFVRLIKTKIVNFYYASGTITTREDKLLNYMKDVFIPTRKLSIRDHSEWNNLSNCTITYPSLNIWLIGWGRLPDLTDSAVRHRSIAHGFKSRPAMSGGCCISFTAPRYLWRSLGPFILPWGQKWS